MTASTLAIASFNVQGVVCAARLDVLLDSIRDMRLDIVAIQSTQYRGADSTLPDGTALLWTSPLPHAAGMGLIVNPQIAPDTRIILRSPRLMVTNFVPQEALCRRGFFFSKVTQITVVFVLCKFFTQFFSD
jgi:hypothetical protein